MSTEGANTAQGQERRFFLLDVKPDGIAVLSAKRDPVNAMHPEFIAALEDVVNEIRERSDVRCVIITSAIPGFFMVGFDLNVLMEMIQRGIKDSDIDAIRHGVRRVHRTIDAIESLPQPTIAAINGHAVGGGAELTLACDIRLIAADPSYRIGFPEVRFGVIPAAGGTQRLPRIIGLSQAMALLLEGRRLPPDEALKVGLVHEVVPADKLLDRARERAAQIVKGGPLALSMIKRLLRADKPPSAGYELEQLAFGECVGSAEGQEGIRAFLEGRKPAFTKS